MNRLWYNRNMESSKGFICGMECYRIKICTKYQTENSIIQGTIEKLQSEYYIEEQQKLIKTLALYLINSEDSEFISSLLTYLFLTINTKHPIRKTILRALLLANNELTKKTFSDNILYVIDTVRKENNCIYARHNDIIINLQNCFNHFPLAIDAVSDDVISYVIDVFLNLVEQLSNGYDKDASDFDIYSYLHNVSKLLVSLLQHCALTPVLSRNSTQFIIATHKIITHESVSFDLKCNCGLLMVIFEFRMSNYISNNLKVRQCLNLLKLESTCYIQKHTAIKTVTNNYTASLCIYSGILNVVPENVLCEEIIDEQPAIVFIFDKVLYFAKRSMGNPNQIIEVGRALVRISKIMGTIPLSSVKLMFEQILDYVWTNLEHCVDPVKHSTKTIFENLIKLAYKHYKSGYMALLKRILAHLTDLLVNRCSHYIALTILSTETSCSFLLQQFSNLPLILLTNMAECSAATQICNTYELLMMQHAKEEINVNKWIEIWVELIKPLLAKSALPLTTFYQRLFIFAYKIQPIILKYVIHYQHSNCWSELGTLLGCLRVARKSGLSVSAWFNSELIDKNWRSYIPFEFLELMMYHQSDQVRVSTLALIVESQKSTEIFSEWELDFLKNYFHYNVTTQTSNIRHQIIALYKKALIRLKEGLAVFMKHNTMIRNKAKGIQSEEEIFKEHQLYKDQEITYKVFIETFFQEYLCYGLFSGYNFTRRATCLQLMAFMINENCIGQGYLKRNWRLSGTMALLNILCDSYESNAVVAFTILKKLPLPTFADFHSMEVLYSNIVNTIAMASAIKLNSASASGYILPIYLGLPYARKVVMDIMQHPKSLDNVCVLSVSLFINLIEVGIKLAKEDILEAVKTTPVYGYILCVRHIIDKGDFSTCNDWEYLLVVRKIVNICKSVSTVVSPIINNSSPEGYMPSMDETIYLKAKHEVVTPQMVLVYAWRTTKEVSLLLGELISNSSNIDPKIANILLLGGIMSSISEHFLNIFLEAKHRGVYEQAYLEFCKLCEKLWRSPNEVFKSWPKMWLADILLTLKKKDTLICQKLCPTRRSAGLPFLIQAIIVAEPRNVANETFHLCIRTLLHIGASTKESVKSRIHATNILRLLYRNNYLGELVTQYISKGIIIALNALKHNKWSIRNAGTLLFASLVVRLFGVQRSRDMNKLSLKNRMPVRIFFIRYFKVCDFLQYQLVVGTQNGYDTATLLPILLILERLYPSNTEEESQLRKCTLYVTKCLSNCIYKLRKLAAQTLASLTPHSKLVSYIRNILIVLSDVTLTDNHCQGFIIQIIYLLQFVKKYHTLLNISDLVEPTFWIFISVGRYTSHYTASLYLDMLASLTSVFLNDCEGALIFAKLSKILTWQLVKDTSIEEVLCTARTKYNLCCFNLHVHIISSLYCCDSYFKSLYIKEFFLSGLYSEHEETKIYCLNFINYLYTLLTKQVKHSLYITERLEISEREYKLVTCLDNTVGKYIIEGIHKDLQRKLLPIFYDLLTKSKESTLCVFLMLQHYPCILNGIKSSKQESLDFFMEWCLCGNSETSCVSLSIISTFLNGLSEKAGRELNYEVLLKVVANTSDHTSALHRRISAAQFLVANRRLFCERSPFLVGEELVTLWNILITLLEDDNQLVRDIISQLGRMNPTNLSSRLEQPFIISDKARENLFAICIELLPSKITLSLLLPWALRRTCEEQLDSFDIFDKGEVNSYVEEEQVAKLAASYLKDVLWKLDDGLNYGDRSIFVEEHALMVATETYNALYQTSSRRVNTNIKTALLYIMNKVLDFLSECPINKHNFKFELENIISKELTGINVERYSDNNTRLNCILKCFVNVKCE